MTAEEAEERKTGDAVTCDGQAGTVAGWVAAGFPPRAAVDWESGRRSTVPNPQLERA